MSGTRRLQRRDFLKNFGVASAALAGGPSLMAIIEACGGGTAQQAPAATVDWSKGGEIRLLQWQSFVPEADKKVAELLDRWAGKHSGWKAVLDTVAANDLQAKTSAAVQSQAGPDIIQFQYNWTWLYSAACVDVGDVVQRLQKTSGKFYDAIAQNCQVKDKWLAVPYTYVPNAWVYRTDAWGQVGKPKFVDTMADLLTYGRQVKQQSTLPVGQALGHSFGDPPTFCYSALWNFGGKEVEKDGKTVAINSKETEGALQWVVESWRDVLDQSGLSWDDSSNNRAYSAKKISATMNGASIYINMLPGRTAADPALKQVTAVAPPLRGPKDQTTIQLNLQHAVMKWSKNQGAAKDLVEFLMQKDTYSEWMQAAAGYNAFPNGSFDSHAVWTSDPNLKLYNDAVRFARWPGWPGPPSQASSRVQTSYYIVDMFAKAVQNPNNIKQVITETEQQLNAAYSRPS